MGTLLPTSFPYPHFPNVPVNPAWIVSAALRRGLKETVLQSLYISCAQDFGQAVCMMLLYLSNRMLTHVLGFVSFCC